MKTKQEPNIEQVTKLIRDYHEKAVKLPYVLHPMAWAVHRAWQDIDRACRKGENSR